MGSFKVDVLEQVVQKTKIKGLGGIKRKLFVKEEEARQIEQVNMEQEKQHWLDQDMSEEDVLKEIESRQGELNKKYKAIKEEIVALKKQIGIVVFFFF